MAHITNYLNRPLHVYEVVNNALAGGVIDIGATGASRATGGFAVATVANASGLMTVTYNNFSGTPIMYSADQASGTADVRGNVVQPNALGGSSAQCKVHGWGGASASACADVSTGVTAHVVLYGNRTDTGIS